MGRGGSRGCIGEQESYESVTGLPAAMAKMSQPEEEGGTPDDVYRPNDEFGAKVRGEEERRGRERRGEEIDVKFGSVG